MARVKRGLASHRKHKKLLEQAKGYMMTRHRLVKKATEAVLHAGQYAYAGRKKKKRVIRQDWIMHINEAVKKEGMSYSKFMNGLKKNNILLDRKVLAQISAKYPDVFKSILEKIK